MILVLHLDIITGLGLPINVVGLFGPEGFWFYFIKLILLTFMHHNLECFHAGLLSLPGEHFQEFHLILSTTRLLVWILRQSRSDCRGNERSIGKLYNAIENCKHVLSTVPVGQCSVESLFDGIDFNCSLSRSRFEALCGGFISKCLSPLEDLLTKANLSKSDIQKVWTSFYWIVLPVDQYTIIFRFQFQFQQENSQK